MTIQQLRGRIERFDTVSFTSTDFDFMGMQQRLRKVTKRLGVPAFAQRAGVCSSTIYRMLKAEAPTQMRGGVYCAIAATVKFQERGQDMQVGRRDG